MSGRPWSHMDAIGDELMGEREGLVAGDDKVEREMGDEDKIEEVGGEINELVESRMVENDTEAVMDDDEDDENVDALVSDSDDQSAGKPARAEKEKGDEKVDALVHDSDDQSAGKPARAEEEKGDEKVDALVHDSDDQSAGKPARAEEEKGDEKVDAVVHDSDDQSAGKPDRAEEEKGDEKVDAVVHDSDDQSAGKPDRAEEEKGDEKVDALVHDSDDQSAGKPDRAEEEKGDEKVDALVHDSDDHSAGKPDRAEEEKGDEKLDALVHDSDDHTAKKQTRAEEEKGNEKDDALVNDSDDQSAGKPARAEEEKGDEKVYALVNDSDDQSAGKPANTKEEKGDTVIAEEIPTAEVKLDVDVITKLKPNDHIKVLEFSDLIGNVSADVREGHAENKEVAAEGSLISDIKMRDEGMRVEELMDLKFDEPVNVAGYREEAVVEEEYPTADIEIGTHARVELESGKGRVELDPKFVEPVNMAENREEAVGEEDHLSGEIKIETQGRSESESDKGDISEGIQLANAEVETESGTEIVADKTADEVTEMETDEARSPLDEPGLEMYDSPADLQDEEDETMFAEETGTQDTEVETETDVAESGKTSGGKRKRGKLTKSPSLSKTAGKASSRKTVGEDVCFICFDGGDLVLCDRRGCPKAYHPSCVNRDEAFFKAKGRWNCGWHLCSICEKTARYFCYTCTFSLCKSCTKDAAMLCVRGNKGFCETCMRTVTLIENNEQGDKDTQVDFDDRSSWEYLFKDYYIELKAKLSLSSVEIEEAKNPWKGGDLLSGPGKPESSETQAEANDGGSGSDDSTENLKPVKPKRRKVRKQSKSLTKEKQLVSTDVAAGSRAISLSDNSEWASKELLEFVSHMKNGDTSFLSQFDVQALLLEYIKINKLRDPRRKSQIICDARLENLFGKPRVGHFEMLKLLELHFIARDEQTDEVQGSVVDTENNQLDIDDDILSKGRRRKTRRKSAPQSNLDDYAAIDMHNISLIYLRRKLMEDLLEDAEMFHDKVVGTFVRIRISGSTQKQDLYRLVQVVGTSKAAEPYKVGKKTTDMMVEILNLDKTEVVLIDTISNQEFTEEECKRLRQSIKCGLISRLTVGEILDKTMEIQVARVNDWLESEVLRLSHLRDRASDLGRRKELRECVEKLQLLKTPEERRRRLEEIPEIHADPKMDPSYESDEKDSESEESRRDAFMRSRVSGYSRRGRGPISPGSDNSSAKVWESSRNPSGNSFSLVSPIDEMGNENSWNLGDKEAQESNNIEKLKSATNSESPGLAVSRSESFSGVTSPENTAVKINESEKMWHYQDPSGKVQGPFSMVQLRKWNNTGYFPAGLKIWKTTENQDNSILLADALAGKFPKELPSGTFLNRDRETSHVDQNLGSHTKSSTEKWARNDITNLPSPTPIRSASINGVLPSPTAVSPNISTHSSVTASVLNSVVQSVNTYSPTPNSQQGILVGSTDSLLQQSTATSQAVQPVVNQNLQPQNYGWATSNVQNPSGTFANPVPQPDFWRPPNQGNQPIMQSPAATPNAGWNAVQQANPNMGGWVNPVPGNTNMNWAPPPMQQQVPTPAGWVAPGGNAGQNVPGPVQGWAAWGPSTVQGPGPGQVPVNGWVPPSGNSGVPAPIQGSTQGNQGSWGGEQSPNGGQFIGQMGAQGRDSGFNGGRPWNRQPSFGGGGGSTYFNKRDQICPYNANGRCRKGARCDYKHV